jgi:hypothetical protein
LLKGLALVGETRNLYAIAESCPFDALLARKMKRAVNALLQLNLKRFRVPQKQLAKYSALDVMKQALELLFEFSPSEKNYREAMRTIQVYSEGDGEMLHTIQDSFRLIANAVYNAYLGQRHAESVSPELLFLQGVQFDLNELQQSFRSVGVKPPVIGPPSVKRTIFLDEGFDPYKPVLEGKVTAEGAQKGREEHWARTISAALDNDATSLIRVGAEHLGFQRSALMKALSRIRQPTTGSLPRILHREGIEIRLVYSIPNVNDVYGKSSANEGRR